ncbi:MAG: D-2-hydroxyacid dehydrogenase [Clostridiales bacterium]|nr:D-2-hydroxyacid dehydrogenase [Clostridiales bacterium]MDY2872034.1 D-2-hydroxyacid dehydrogenase [Eubacteriales bacterium]
MSGLSIVALDALQLNDLDWSALEALGDVTRYDGTAPDQVPARAGDADVLLVNKVKLPESVLSQLPKLKYVGVLATGYDNVDTAAAARRNIAVTNVPGYSSDSVAQLTFALLLELCHHAGEHSRRVLEEKAWSRQPYYCFWDFPLSELAGRTMGVVGLGRIGVRVAEIARAFGMNVIAYTRTPKEIAGVKCVDFDTLLAESDVISLNCPLTEQTRGLINADALARMKKTAYLINTSRGGVIVEDDLRRALDAGMIAGAAVDVLSSEPPTEDNPLLHAKNIIVTPHIAWATTEARTRLLSIVTDNLSAYLRGEKLNRV